jgi:hypothetical protein
MEYGTNFRNCAILLKFIFFLLALRDAGPVADEE